MYVCCCTVEYMNTEQKYPRHLHILVTEEEYKFLKFLSFKLEISIGQIVRTAVADTDSYKSLVDSAKE